MNKDKPPPKKKKVKLDSSMSQKERFIEYAREVESDESGRAFNKFINSLKKIGKRNDRT